MANEFAGKIACVTGASRGIGAATAVALARNGVEQVIVHFNSYRKGACDTAAAVREAGSDAILVSADLASSDGINCLIEQLGKIPAIDILVNNAGALIQRSPLLEYPEDLFDRVMTLNAKSVWFLTQAVAPLMLQNSGGVVVNVSSIAARNGGSIGAAVYAAAKAAVSAMTKGMARELAPKGIRVNAISPGTVDNHFHEAFSSREMLDSVIAATPAGRLGTDQEMADAIVFLCSEGARYIHGQTIELNGGMFMV